MSAARPKSDLARWANWAQILSLPVAVIGTLISVGVGPVPLTLGLASVTAIMAVGIVVRWVETVRARRSWDFARTDLSFSVDSLRAGQVVRGSDLPLTITGRYMSTGPVAVWVVLGDSFGHLYLQNPPVDFLPNGHWRATNVNIGRGVDIVNFLRVDLDGDQAFRQMVARRDFGAFTELPPGSMRLVAVPISRHDD
jgi:hypothetical protein